MNWRLKLGQVKVTHGQLRTAVNSTVSRTSVAFLSTKHIHFILFMVNNAVKMQPYHTRTDDIR